MTDQLTLISLLESAKEAEIGLVVKSSSPSSIQQQLYTARRNAARDDLDDIKIIRPAKPNTLWLVRADKYEELRNAKE